MSALDELERSLSRAVDAGAAADPTRAADARRAADQAHAADGVHATATDQAHVRARPQGLSRLRPRRGWHVFLTILVAGGVTTGALAATGQLRVVTSDDRTSNPNYQVMSFPGFDSKPTAEPTLLPLRAKDPRGGPDWALRTFPISRGQLCAQAGQLYEGKFGIVTQVVDREKAPSADGPAPATTVFQVLPASASMFGVRCGVARPGGQLVASNRMPTVFVPDGADLRCGNSPPSNGVAPCPITGVRVVRWGFVGPRAKTATFVHAGGRRGKPQQVDPGTGGAYLFAESVDPAPFRESQAFEAKLRDQIDAKFPRRAYGSIPKAERPAEDRRWRRRNAYVGKVYRAARSERRAQWNAQQGEAIEATFQGGETRRVAGHGSKGGALPGLEPLSREVPKVTPTAVRVTFLKRTRAVEVRFRSPVALDVSPGRYTITARGPVGVKCTAKLESTQADYARQTAKGDEILVRVRPSYGSGGGPHTPAWCAGRSYSVRVRHIADNPRRGGPMVEQLVGKASFTAR